MISLVRIHTFCVISFVRSHTFCVILLIRIHTFYVISLAEIHTFCVISLVRIYTFCVVLFGSIHTFYVASESQGGTLTRFEAFVHNLELLFFFFNLDCTATLLKTISLFYTDFVLSNCKLFYKT